MILYYVLLCFGCGGFAATCANQKGYEGFAWFFAGLIFGPVGLLGAAGLPDKRLREGIAQLKPKTAAVNPLAAKIAAEPQDDREVRALVAAIEEKNRTGV